MISIAVGLLLQSWPGASMAARVDDLYSADVSVQDRSEEAREAALEDAMRMVLVRVTGSPQAAARSELEPLIERSASFVQAYRYMRGNANLRLSVSFDGQAVQEAAAASGVPVWGPERPRLLVWLAIDYGGGQRLIVPADSEGPVARTLQAAARERGLPISLPLMDAQDRQRISFADVWGGFTEAVEAASARYAPDAILVGRARRRQSGRLGVEWKLHFGAELMAEQGGIGDGIQRAADYFAQQFAIGGRGQTGRFAQLEVADIDSLRHYARVIEHLEKLSVVENVRLSEVSGDAVVFELTLKGTLEQLRRAIALGNVLAEQRFGPAGPPPGRDLHYRPAL